MKLTSVLIRSTGRPELNQALASVSKQTYSNIEVVIVDAMGLGKIPKPKEYIFPIRIINTGNRLQRSEAANALIREAKGEWAVFLDDDDWMDCNHIEKLHNALEAEPDAVLAYSGVSCVEKDSKNVFQEIRRFDEPFDPVRLLVENYIPIHAPLFNLSMIQKENGPRFDPEFSLFEDWDFWLQCLALGKFIHSPGISARYRIHSNSGVGVRIISGINPEVILDKLLEKWRYLWTTEQLHSLIGYSRNVVTLKEKVKELETSILVLQEKLKEKNTLAEEYEKKLQSIHNSNILSGNNTL